MSRVSIIIPCFNAGDFLSEALISALAQSHEDMEVVVVDDGSTDARTIEILDGLSDPRVIVLHQPNAGPAAARNRGIQAASGEYILPLDADDRFDPSYASKALAVMLQNMNAGIVYCNAIKFGEDSGKWQLPEYNLREIVIDNVIFCSGMFRKKDWARVGGYNEKLLHGMEDYDFWLKIVDLGREVIKIDEGLFFYRIQQRSRTTRFMDEKKAVIATYAEIFRSNKEFFLRNIEFLYEHRLDLYRELEHYRSRYGAFDNWLESHGWLKNIARVIKRCF